MANPKVIDAPVEEKNPVISDAARNALHKLPAPEAITVLQEYLKLAADCDNNNNNNNNSNHGGCGCAGTRSFTREDLVQKINESMSDVQLHAILKQHGIA
jgi:hypothetical protein